MKNTLLIEENENFIQLSLLRYGEKGEDRSEPIALKSVITGEELSDLQWYFEEYLSDPEAVWGKRGKSIEQNIEAIGETLFNQLFHSPETKNLLKRLREKSNPQIHVCSHSSKFMNLPWELLKDPNASTFLEREGIPIVRNPQAIAVDLGERNSWSIKVLVVMVRPSVGPTGRFENFVLPLLERSVQFIPQLELEILRPPTLETLATKLNRSQEPFDIVHFNCPASFQNEQAHLALESSSGSLEMASVEELCRVLNANACPIVFFSSYYFDKLNDRRATLEVCQQILKFGAKAVMAFGYPVMDNSAANFLTIFYHHLIRHGSLIEATYEGRKFLQVYQDRSSGKGFIPFSDWFVPLLFLNSNVVFPLIESRLTSPNQLAEQLIQISEQGAVCNLDPESPIKPIGHFVGRTKELYLLEKYARTSHLAIIHGAGGIGKTELAKAFGRWMEQTGSVERIIFTSFAPGMASMSLDGLITSFGLMVFGPSFSQELPTPEQRVVAVQQMLQDYPILWIWDHFETVHSSPDPNGTTLPLKGKELEELKRFIQLFGRKSRSSLVITSQDPERWLGVDAIVNRIELPGMCFSDAGQWINRFLDPKSILGTSRQNQDFGELMKFVDGHPLGLRLIIRHLSQLPADKLLKRLNATPTLPFKLVKKNHESKQLGQILHYTFQKLGTLHQNRIFAFCLFEGIVDANTLAVFSDQSPLPTQFEGLDRNDWNQTLRHCEEAGILNSIHPGIFQIPPAVARHLTALWQIQAGDSYFRERAMAKRANIFAHATIAGMLFEEIQGNQSKVAFLMLHLEHRTFGKAAAESLESGMFEATQQILQILDEYWNDRGLHEEAKAWMKRACSVLEDSEKRPPNINSYAGQLWMFLKTSQANRFIDAGLVERAMDIYLQLKSSLDQSPEANMLQRPMASVYQLLGNLEQSRGNLDDAARCYHSSLQIMKALGNKVGMAEGYENLLGIAKEQKNFVEALDWAVRSVALYDSFPPPIIGNVSRDLVQITEKMGGIDTLNERWQACLGVSLREDVKQWVLDQMDKTKSDA